MDHERVAAEVMRAIRGARSQEAFGLSRERDLHLGIGAQFPDRGASAACGRARGYRRPGQLAQVREMRAIIAQSHPVETVALASFQLVQLTRDG